MFAFRTGGTSRCIGLAVWERWSLVMSECCVGGGEGQVADAAGADHCDSVEAVTVRIIF